MRPATDTAHARLMVLMHNLCTGWREALIADMGHWSGRFYGCPAERGYHDWEPGSGKPWPLWESP